MIIPKSNIISTTRIRQGLSMRELARQAGINIGTVSNMESKSSSVTPKTAKSVCDVLNVPFDDLFTITKKGA